MNNNFSENLKKIRKDNNLSQEQLAEELGVSRQSISKWESASAYPEMDKIIALCDKFDIDAKVQGGGFSGQTGAVRLGITRALLEYDSNTDPSSESSFRKILKSHGFITRDSRKKERKKPGLKKARRAPQFSKR